MVTLSLGGGMWCVKCGCVFGEQARWSPPVRFGSRVCREGARVGTNILTRDFGLGVSGSGRTVASLRWLLMVYRCFTGSVGN